MNPSLFYYRFETTHTRFRLIGGRNESAFRKGNKSIVLAYTISNNTFREFIGKTRWRKNHFFFTINEDLSADDIFNYTMFLLMTRPTNNHNNNNNNKPTDRFFRLNKLRKKNVRHILIKKTTITTWTCKGAQMHLLIRFNCIKSNNKLMRFQRVCVVGVRTH